MYLFLIIQVQRLLPKHPDDSEMGYRNWPSPKNGDIIVLEKDDIDEEIRLKEFANATVKSK